MSIAPACRRSIVLFVVISCIAVGGCGSSDFVMRSSQILQRPIVEDLPYYPIDVPEGSVRTPEYRMAPAIVRTSDGEFVMMRHKDDSIWLEHFNSALVPTWSTSVTFPPHEYLASLFVLDGKIHLIDTRYKDSSRMEAVHRTFDSATGRFLDSHVLDVCTGAMKSVAAEPKEGGSPYSMIFSPDSSHILLTNRDYTWTGGASPTLAYMINAIILDRTFREVNRFRVPVIFRGSNDSHVGIWPTNDGNIVTVNRRGGDSVVATRYDLRHPGARTLTYPVPQISTDNDLHNYTGAWMGVHMLDGDAVLVATALCRNGSSTLRSVELLRYDFTAGTAKKIGEYIPDDRANYQMVGNKNLSMMRVSELVAGPGNRIYAILERQAYETIVPGTMRWASVDGWVASEILVMAFDSNGTYLWQQGIRKAQKTVGQERKAMLGYCRSFDSKGNLLIGFQDHGREVFAVATIHPDGSSEPLEGLLGMGDMTSLVMVVNSFTTWLNDRTILALIVNGSSPILYRVTPDSSPK